MQAASCGYGDTVTALQFVYEAKNSLDSRNYTDRGYASGARDWNWSPDLRPAQQGSTEGGRMGIVRCGRIEFSPTRDPGIRKTSSKSRAASVGVWCGGIDRCRALSRNR